MSTTTPLWPDIRRAVAQWAGVTLAAILSGVLLGILMHQGMGEKVALEVSLPIGFLFALLFWIWATRYFSRVTVPVSVPTSNTALTFEGNLTVAYSYQMPPAVPTFACQSQGPVA